MMVWAILAIGVISFIVWAHHVCERYEPYFQFFSLPQLDYRAVPTALVYNWVLTLWRSSIHMMTVPMLFVIGFYIYVYQW
jgi:cytochrome c oxidase subunit 1